MISLIEKLLICFLLVKKGNYTSNYLYIYTYIYTYIHIYIYTYIFIERLALLKFLVKIRELSKAIKLLKTKINQNPIRMVRIHKI